MDIPSATVEAERAYALDELISDYISTNEIAVDEYNALQEAVLQSIDPDGKGAFENDVTIVAQQEEGDLSTLSSLDATLPDLAGLGDLDNSTNDQGIGNPDEYGGSGSI